MKIFSIQVKNSYKIEIELFPWCPIRYESEKMNNEFNLLKGPYKIMITAH